MDKIALGAALLVSGVIGYIVAKSEDGCLGAKPPKSFKDGYEYGYMHGYEDTVRLSK